MLDAGRWLLVDGHKTHAQYRVSSIQYPASSDTVSTISKKSFYEKTIIHYSRERAGHERVDGLSLELHTSTAQRL